MTKGKNTPECQMSLDYIKALTGRADAKVTWQYFHDQQSEKIAGTQTGQHFSIRPRMEKQQQKGCGVFIMVNEGNGKGRKAENVTRVRALFIDLDGAPMEPAVSLLKPHIVVESSPGRYHLYWKVCDCPLDQFKPVQQAIAAKFSGDKSCVDLSRVLRVPGFYHLKSDPFLTRLMEVNDHPQYTLEEIIVGLGLSIPQAVFKDTASTPSDELKVSSALPDKPDTLSAKPHVKDTASTVLTMQKVSFANYEYVNPSTGEIFNLKEFAIRNPDFQIADALAECRPQVLVGEPKDGKQHIRCPFEKQHTREGEDTATFCMNGEASATKGFVIKCMHDHCAGRDRLDFLNEMLQQGWLQPNVLSSPSYLLQPSPEWCAWYEADFASDPRVQSLTQIERVHWRAICTMMLAEGTLQDKDWQLARLLGLEEGDWQAMKTTYQRLGLLQIQEGRLINRRALREFQKAQDAYDRKVRGGRKGGSCSKKEDRDVPS